MIMTKKRLAIVIADFNVGGGQKVVLDLLKVMDTECFQIKLFVHEAKPDNQFTRELDTLGICVEYVHRGSGVTLRNYMGMARALNAYAPDVVHIHLDMVYVPLWALFHRNKRVIFTMHSQPYRQYGNPVIKQLHRCLALRKNYTITGVSQVIARETERILGLSENQALAICNPVHVGELPVREQSPCVSFINVARFNPVKNHRLLLEAFAQLLKQKNNCILQLAGDGKEKESCEEYARQLGIWEQVRFLGNVSDVTSLLRESDVFVLSSDSEAMPISVLEAMAHGLPIISTAVGGVPELIDGNGILVEKGNAQALCAAMEQLVRDPIRRNEFGKRSYEMVQRFRADKIAEEYQKLYSL